MGSGLPRKEKQCKKAASRYKISNVFERESGCREQGRLCSLITEALSQKWKCIRDVELNRGGCPLF